MKRTAIVCCVGGPAADFLYLTLPQNKQFFDEYIVVTDEQDAKITRICENEKDSKVVLIKTNVFYKLGCKFNRGAAHNDVFDLLWNRGEKFGQIFLMDVDCFIPNELGKVIQEYNYDIEYFYGARRIIVPQYKDFERLLKGDKAREDTLWCPSGGGWGYFQCFNYHSSTFQKDPHYPESYYVSESDWKFRNRWGETINGDKEYKGLLKELPAKIWHLGQPNIEGAANFWN